MLLIDFTQTMIAGLMAQLKSTQGELSESLLRHMVLNTIKTYTKNFADEYGEVVLCSDARYNWRRDFYPYYKANRKKARDKSELDWSVVFETLHKVRDEIKDNFPYKFIQVEKCEADDIIAVLVRNKKPNDKILIISGDKDFQQLQKYPFVSQWSPNLNKFVKCDRPDNFLKEHILRGDKSDGIPNILSSDDCLAEGVRQKPLRKNMFDAYMRIVIDKDDKYYRNYLRNQTLIDLEMIPKHIEEQILFVYSETEVNHGKVFDYMRHHKLNELMDHIEDFRL